MSNERLRVLDFETCGIAPPAAVIEVGWCDLVRSEDSWHIEAPDSYLCSGDITAETRAIHHISPTEILVAAPAKERAAMRRGPKRKYTKNHPRWTTPKRKAG